MFYKCAKCGQIVGVITDACEEMTCAGEPMECLKANSVDASQEKHIPEVTRNGDELIVKVGSVPHPMMQEHSIEWVYVNTVNGGQRQELRPGQEPQAVFCVKYDEPVKVYAYCNLHGLWVAEV